MSFSGRRTGILVLLLAVVACVTLGLLGSAPADARADGAGGTVVAVPDGWIWD
ncbi:MAG TPA: hypothetical protein VL738_40430 [Dactylosporangium sp.]|nr:hypothetical protein [Dactylosporangium sp.]